MSDTTTADDRVHPLLRQRAGYWRDAAAQWRADGYPRLAESYEQLADEAERVSRAMQEKAS